MKALVIGGAMIDTIAIIPDDAIERMSLLNAGSSYLLLEEGRKTEALEISTHCGGGAINVAVALARLDISCEVLIKLGRDRRAEQILARLEEEGVSHRWASHDEREPTGASVLVSSHDRNAGVFTFRGANTQLAEGDLQDGAFETEMVYIANLSNQAAHCFPIIVEKARSKGALVAANPGIRQLTGHSETFQSTLPSLDILALNAREADAVSGMLGHPHGGGATLLFPKAARPATLAARGLRFEGREMSLRAFFRGLIARGVGCVVLTDGSEGAFAAAGDRLYYCPAQEAVVAGTAGAGDAFASTFTAYRAGGNSLEDALRAASVNAASVLAHVDTQTGLMPRAALEAALHSGLERTKPTLNVISWPL